MLKRNNYFHMKLRESREEIERLKKELEAKQDKKKEDTDMSNPSKQKGTAFETLIRDYLVSKGFPKAHRTALSGGQDTGDINGIANLHTDAEVAVQCKNQKKFNLSGWLDATVEQAERLDNAVPILVVKRPGKGAHSLDDTYAVMRLCDVVSLLKEAMYT